MIFAINNANCWGIGRREPIIQTWPRTYATTTGAFHGNVGIEELGLNVDADVLAHEVVNALSVAAKDLISSQDITALTIIETLDQVEASLLFKVQDHPHLVAETKRRVAEWKFDLLSRIDYPFDEMAAIHQSIRDLKYFDLHREITREVIFARYCIRSEKADIARSILKKLEDRLEHAFQADDFGAQETTPQLREHFRDLKKRLRELKQEISDGASYA